MRREQHDALDAEIEHAGALGQELAEGGEEQRRRDADERREEADLEELGERSCMAQSRMRARDAQPIRGEQQGRQHGEQRDALDHVGQVDRHAGRARHAAGAGDDDGEEERGRQDAERIEPASWR